MHPLGNIHSIAKLQKLIQQTIIIYIDNKQVIDYSSLPHKGSGPFAFMVEDFCLLDGIRNYTKILKSHHKIILQQKHIYNHLNKKKKQQDIIQKYSPENYNNTSITPQPDSSIIYMIKIQLNTTKKKKYYQHLFYLTR